MWRPTGVVPQHRKRARCIWMALLCSITAYTIWEIVTIALERQNPTTSYTVSNDQYGFPYVLVCMWPEFGCSDEDVTACIDSAVTESTKVEYNGTIYSGTKSELYTNCIDFDLTSFTVLDEEEQQELRATANLQMLWLSSDTASYDDFYTEKIGVYLGPSAEEAHEFSYVPYSRVNLSADSFDYSTTDMTIGKTTRKSIGGDKTTTYPVLTLSTAGQFEENVSGTTSSVNDDTAIGVLFLSITQGSYSLSNINEVDPLEIGTLLGNIGGFWELLIIVWGLCFIATTHEHEPKFKARNFTKSIQHGTEIITRRRSLSESASTISETREQRPHWEAAYRGPTATSMQSGSHQDAVGVSNPSHRRPLPTEIPQRTTSRFFSKAAVGDPVKAPPPSYDSVQRS